MSNPYFRKVPDFDYVSRTTDKKNLSDYISVKNLFKRGKIREDIIQDLSFFTKYKIIGDNRPDNVAYELYEDPTLDWIILLCNNIQNVYTEWPLPQDAFYKFIDQKYGSLDASYETKHYETIEIRSSDNQIIIPQGLIVDKNFETRYYDAGLGIDTFVSNITIPVTYFEYENKIEDKKRNIYVLKSRYLNVVLNDMDQIMAYKEGSTQYVSETQKKSDNIRLFS